MSERENHRRYRAWLQALPIEELENETYTLRHERRYLDNLTDDEVAERLSMCEAETAQRMADRFKDS